MGQTQILFIVLAVIIVGIAVAVGITQFGESAVDANKNAVLLDCQNIVARSQQWYKKPKSLAGGGGSFTGIDLGKISVARTNENTNAAGFVLTCPDSNTVQVVGNGREPGVTVTMTYTASDGKITTTTTP